jgi:hypothetical protein
MSTFSIPPNTFSAPPNTFSAPPNTITLHSTNKEVFRITHDGRLVTGEGLSADEATQEAAKLLIASFEAEIKKMVEKRIAAACEVEHALRAEVERLDAEKPWLKEANARAERAEAERDALAKDKARLDWLSVSDAWFDYPATGAFTPKTMRAAIDAAMKS